MLADQATAAPVIPSRGISHRFSPTFTARPTPVFSRFSPLRPDMTSTVITGPVATENSIASDRIVSAVRPPANPAPNTRRASGENAASDR